ncbi:MAG: MMPL family transporter [Fuerstiella sp.]|nr:MMPL family transporter [Fuerstiella sp.]
MFSRCVGSIVGHSARRPRIVLWLMVFIGCAAVGVTVSDLKLKSRRSDLLGPDQAWQDYNQAFGGESDLVVVVETDGPNPQLIQTVLSQLGSRLEREPELFSDVLYQVDQSALRRKGLQYLNTQQLQSAIRRVGSFDPILREEQWDLLRIERLADQLQRSVQSANNEGKTASATRYAERFAASLNHFLPENTQESVVNSGSFKSPWPEIVDTEIEHSAEDSDLAFLMNDDRSVGMLHVLPVSEKSATDGSAASIARLREHLAELVAEYGKLAPDLKLSATGIPALEYDELQRSGRDMINASLIAFIAVGLLLAFGLRGLRHPVLVLIMLVLALALTFGLATLAVGHLNILSICFAAIMIGLGVDFGIHFVTRYLFLRQELYEMDESLVLTGTSVGSGILTSAATTAIAFGSAALTGYPGLAELGIISAGGILICALLTFTFLPALIALSDERVDIDDLPEPRSGKMWRLAVEGYPLAAIIVAVIAIGAVAWQAGSYQDGELKWHVNYDANLMRLQDNSLPSVRAEKTLSDSDDSLLYAVALADSKQAVDTLRAQFIALPTVGRVTDLSSKLPDPPNVEQQQLIQTLASQLQNLPTKTPTFTTSNPIPVGTSVDRLYKALKASPNLDSQRAAETLDEFLDRLAALSSGQQAAVIEAYQNLMVSSLLKEFQQVARATSLEPVSHQDLPAVWRNRYLRADGERELWLMKIYPKQDIWEHDALGAFVKDLRSVESSVTGVPIQNFDSASKMKDCYTTIAIYSVAAIALFLLFDFLRPGQKMLTIAPPLLVVGFVGYTAMQRATSLNPHMLVAIYLSMVAFIATVFDVRNLRDTLLALIPPVGGGLILLGLMALLNVDFNPINLIVLPLVLGIGVDDGIHMVHDYRRQLANGSREYSPSGDTVNGVLLTSLTSIVGFGSLMIAAHQGLKSVGIVLALGIASCLAVALILLPPLLVLVARYQPASLEPVRPPKVKKPPAGAAESDSAEAAAADNPKRLSRKERRRQAA